MSFIQKSRTWIASFLQRHPVAIERVCIGIAAIAIFTQLTTLSSVLFQRADSRAVIRTMDDDSGMGIGNAEKTYLLNDNGTQLYGPVYYRISSIFRNFGVSQYADNFTPQQHKERSIYYHLMLINLLGVYLASALIASLVTRRVPFLLLGTWILTGAFLQGEWRATLLFMAKPDHLFAGLVVLAMALTWKWLQSENHKQDTASTTFKWMAFGWGLAACTKLAFLFFVPGLFLMFYQKPFKAWVRQSAVFLGWTLFFYMLIGFPQNFDFWKELGYLIDQNAQASPVSWEFLKNNWGPLFIGDVVAPALALILVVFLFFQRKAVSWNLILRLSLPVLVAALWLFSKQTTAPHQWYTFPIVNGLLFVGGLSLINLLSAIPESWAKKWSSLQGRWSYLVIVFLTLPMFVEALPVRIWQTNKQGMNCRQEARVFERLVNEKSLAQKMILADPYIPYSQEFHDKQVWMAYDMTLAYMDRIKPDYIALKRAYYQVYMPKSEGGQELPMTHVADIEKTREFYRLFFNKSETRDPQGNRWVKTHDDGCTFELWEKKAPPGI